MTKLCKDIGLDTHKDTIAVAVADVGHAKPRYYGEIAMTLPLFRGHPRFRR